MKKMMPPINGMQASAAATLDGRPLDVDLVIGSGAGSGGGVTGGGRFGSPGSGMGLVTQSSGGFVNSECFRERPLRFFIQSGKKLLILLSLRGKIVTLQLG